MWGRVATRSPPSPPPLFTYRSNNEVTKLRTTPALNYHEGRKERQRGKEKGEEEMDLIKQDPFRK